MDTNANAPTKHKYLSLMCVSYGQPASTSTQDVSSMTRDCPSTFNLTKRRALLVSTTPYMARNQEVNAKKSVYYRKNLRLDDEDMGQANVMLTVRPQTGDMREALVGEHVFDSNPRL